ncbi:methyl-accepting chemotaxis protein [Chthonobacter albigriseus]|uniref:methyl-accepting chemotaxis protein n=1 Tax=Chthonobacter albigriseus TaxID=1683161 RepID=UPI0015EF86E4|nr:methyl-accepting chemotaxis protein [Chthonobacter albigriseus]
MVVDLGLFTVVHANKASRDAFDRLRPVLAQGVVDLVGQSIEILFRGSTDHRNLRTDLAKLPFETTVGLGEALFRFRFDALPGAGDRKAVVTWSETTSSAKADREATQLRQMIDDMPINVMFCDPKTFIITYANRTSIETLRRLEQFLPIKADQLVGSSVDIFHKRPEHQRALLANPANLPHTALIKVGPETLELRVAPIRDKQGTYIGPMLSWAIVTDRQQLAESVVAAVREMEDISGKLSAASTSMLERADRAESMAGSVAAASEEMTATIGDMAERTALAAGRAHSVNDAASVTEAQISSLVTAVERIGEITRVIEQFAAQTKLLALNATIEAARAGEAGRGFSVVAAEVKALSDQTAKATDDIKTQVGRIQVETQGAATSVGEIVRAISEISALTTEIAGSVEEQRAVSEDVSRTIANVATEARYTGEAAKEVTAIADRVTTNSSALERQVKGFVDRR